MNDFYNLKLNINKELSSKRLDKILTANLQEYSRTQIKTLILNGNVTKNGIKVMDPSYITKENEIFYINIILKKKEIYQPENIDLDIVYEDQELIIINKPPNLVVHPAPGNQNGTLVNALIHHTRNKLSNLGENNRPGIVHRLDKDTSGILVIAKNNLSHSNLGKQFSEHSIVRKYKCLVWGVVRPLKGRIETLISRHQKNRQLMSVSEFRGKKAITNYKS